MTLLFLFSGPYSVPKILLAESFLQNGVALKYSIMNIRQSVNYEYALLNTFLRQVVSSVRSVQDLWMMAFMK